MARTHSMAFLLSLICLCAHVEMGAGQKCPGGQVSRLTPGGVTRCCKPWRFTCPINYPYTTCDKDGGWDFCRKCPPGYIQPNLSNSTSPMSCYKNRPICNEDSVPLNAPGSTKGRNPSCACDRAANYFPLMPGGVACDFKPNGCPAGQELQTDGTCLDCFPGTYKNWSGYGLCRPWTNCERDGLCTISNGTISTDTQCGYPGLCRLFVTTGPTTRPSEDITQHPGDLGVNHVTFVPTVLAIVAGLMLTFLVACFLYLLIKRRKSGQGREKHSDTREPEVCRPLHNDVICLEVTMKPHAGIG